MSEKRVLVIGYVWPEPASSAAGSHLLSLIALFTDRGWRVHYASPAQRGEHEADLEGLGIECHGITINCSSFDQFVSELDPQAVLFDRFMMEEQFGWRVSLHCPYAIRLLDMEDMHSLRLSRHAAVKSGRSYREAELITDHAKREVAAIYRCDLTLVISEVEVSLLCKEYGVPPSLLVYCPFMLAPYDGTPPGFQEREHFLSIGNFRHAPNWDAVLQLKQSVWPIVRAAVPEAELHIYGAYPPPKATQLHNEKEGFLVKGWAADAREVMSQARVCLAPLRFGAGLKGKLAEAMICGTPSVTTSVGAEGLQGELPWAGMVSDTMEDFAEAAIELYSNQHEWDEAQQRGQQILNENFPAERIKKRVWDRIDHTRSTLDHHRAGNFIGAMLQHHSMKSSQYMSMWIEEKNKT